MARETRESLEHGYGYTAMLCSVPFSQVWFISVFDGEDSPMFDTEEAAMDWARENDHYPVA